MSKIATLPGYTKDRLAVPFPSDPQAPVPFDSADQRALKALRDGTASEEQQKRALGWLLYATGYRLNPWRSNPYDAAYMSGRAQIGRQVYDMLEAAVLGSVHDEQGVR
jgi:hypothetical protein